MAAFFCIFVRLLTLYRNRLPMNRPAFLFCLALVAVACGQAPQKKSNLPVYLDDAQPLEARVDDAFSRMTLDEKIAMEIGRAHV